MVETATNNLDIGKEFRVVSQGCGLPTSRKDVSVLGPVKHQPLSWGRWPCLTGPAHGGPDFGRGAEARSPAP